MGLGKLVSPADSTPDIGEVKSQKNFHLGKRLDVLLKWQRFEIRVSVKIANFGYHYNSMELTRLGQAKP